MARNGTDRLFAPMRMGRHFLPNRIVMAPMTRSRAVPGGIPGPLAATYYAQRASAGLIITEAAHVSPEGVGYPGTPGMHTAEQVEGWRTVTRAVHERGGRVFVQLWHVGRVSHPCMQPGGALPVAPSPIAPSGEVYTSEGRRPFVVPRALTVEEIPGVVEQFAHAARLAREAEFDGVDVHAANGYLIDQFLRDGSNQRADGYGGTIENRARLLLEVVTAVGEVWGRDAVGVRLSPLNSYNCMHDSDPASTFGYVVSALDGMGIGYLHVAEPGPGHPLATPDGLRLVHDLRSAFRGCFVIDGGRDRSSAEGALDATAADLVALATPFISNPDLIERLAEGLPLTQPDASTFYEGGPRGYIDYPRYQRSVSHPTPPSLR